LRRLQDLAAGAQGEGGDDTETEPMEEPVEAVGELVEVGSP